MTKNRIISAAMVVILLVTMLMIFPNKAEAASTYFIDEADLYSKGELVCFTYQNNLIGVEFVVYKKDGVEYPAYCLNKNLPGVTEDESYTVSVDKLVTDNKIWRAVTNGYPYKTPSQLGVNSEIEAFAATKMAVYDMMYNYDWDDFKGRDAQGVRVIKAAKKISDIARSSKETKPVSIVNFGSVNGLWAVDSINKDYASKEFSINANVECAEYTIKLNKVEDIRGIKLVDTNNVEKSTFKIGEKFKIMIPITELYKNGTIEIEATAKVKTKPILYGDSGSSSKQSYALAGADYEFDSTKIKVNYLKNSTKITIIKKDAETKEPLAGAKFNILDENKNIVYSDLVTNENGEIFVEGIKPGKYYVQEVKSPDGYTIYKDPISVNVGLYQGYSLTMNNYEEPEDEEKEVEDASDEVTGEKIENLPRTGF